MRPIVAQVKRANAEAGRPPAGYGCFVPSMCSACRQDLTPMCLLQPRHGWMDCAHPCCLDFHQLDGYLLCAV